MSVDSAITLTLEPQNDGWQLSVLGCLVEAGWRMDDHGKVVYLPLGDDDDFDWRELGQGEGDVQGIFKAKLIQGEPLGIVLSWGETQVGGTAIIQSSGMFIFSASMNRRCIPDSPTTDVSWYLEKLLPAFKEAGVYVASWEWTEVI